MENIEIIKSEQGERHLRFGLGVIIGLIFGVILGAIASYSYVTNLASSLTSFTHVTQDVNKLVSFSYDSNQWNRDEEKLTFLNDAHCLIYPGTEEIDLTGLVKTEEKLKVYNSYNAVDATYLENNRPKKRIVSFDITPNFGNNNDTERIKYIFALEQNPPMQSTVQQETCNQEFENRPRELLRGLLYVSIWLEPTLCGQLPTSYSLPVLSPLSGRGSVP